METYEDAITLIVLPCHTYFAISIFAKIRYQPNMVLAPHFSFVIVQNYVFFARYRIFALKCCASDLFRGLFGQIFSALDTFHRVRMYASSTRTYCAKQVFFTMLLYIAHYVYHRVQIKASMEVLQEISPRIFFPKLFFLPAILDRIKDFVHLANKKKLQLF